MIVCFLAGLLLLWLTVGAYVFFRACRRTKELPWLDREAIEKTDFAPHAESIQKANVWIQAHNPQDVWIYSHDGLKLHALWIQAKEPIATVLLAHGYHSTYLVDFGGALDSYHNQGLNLLIPDQRCHGQSEGCYTTFGVKESKDMLSWVDYHNETLWKGPVILSGMSMGASTVMYVADEALPENVCAIIADCGFSSPGDIIGKVFTDVTHLPDKPWIFAAELFARTIGGFRLWEKNTYQCLRKNKIPILMIHGKADDFVPCAMTEKAFSLCSADKDVLLVDNAGHGLSYPTDREKYSMKVHMTFRKVLGEAYELRNNQKL